MIARTRNAITVLSVPNLSRIIFNVRARFYRAPVIVRTRNAIMVSNVVWLEGHLEPNCHCAFLNVP